MPRSGKMDNCDRLGEGMMPTGDAEFKRVDKRYMKILFVRILLVYLILMGCAPLLLLLETGIAPRFLIAAEALLAIAFAVNMAYVRQIYTFKGYQTDDEGMSYRSGIFFPTVTTLPFCKIQQVSIRMNPLSRIFGLCYLDVINGAQGIANQMTIPGLTHDEAETLKSLLMAKTTSHVFVQASDICGDDE